MLLFYAFYGALMLLIIGGGISGYIKAGAGKREKQRAEAEAARAQEERRAEAEERAEQAERVRQALKDAYFGLRKQRAAGFGPWLSACLSNADPTAENAIEAMHRTAEVLNTYCRGRYDLGCIYSAIATLS